MAFPLGVAGSCLKCAVTTVSTVSTNNTGIPTCVSAEPSPCVVHVIDSVFGPSVTSPLEGLCPIAESAVKS